MNGWLVAVFVASVVAVGAVGMFCVRRRFVEVTVNGTSMAPTFSGGERILFRRAGVRRLRRGDIVVVRYPTVPMRGPNGELPSADNLLLVKRVTAIAGDPVPADVAEAAGRPAGSRIPEGRFVVLGDNAEGSLDSRMCGLFGAESLLGIMAKGG